MSFFVACECGRSFESSEANAGGVARCPRCGREWPMPKLESRAGLEEEDWSLGRTGTLGDQRQGDREPGGGLPLRLRVPQRRARIPLRSHRVQRHQRQRRPAQGPADGGRRDRPRADRLPPHGRVLRAGDPIGSRGRPPRRRQQPQADRPAIQYYHEAYGCLPPAAITDKTGKPLLSSRIAILPHLLSDPRYLDFHFDEPWDSPHNLALLEPVPFVYTCPGDLTPKKGMTHFVAVIGPNTAFTPDFRPLTYRDFTDGIGNTLLIGESRRGVPWTKPEDLPLDMSIPFTGLGSITATTTTASTSCSPTGPSGSCIARSIRESSTPSSPAMRRRMSSRTVISRLPPTTKPGTGRTSGRKGDTILGPWPTECAGRRLVSSGNGFGRTGSPREAVRVCDNRSSIEARLVR